MKRLLTLLILLTLVVSLSYSQSPEAFKYQAMARDQFGNSIINKQISLKISIIQGGENGLLVYSEIHDVTTNSLGLVSLNIGKGESLNGTFSDIKWGESNHYVQIAMDENGGDNFKTMGTAELLSVPYALYAKSAGSLERDEKNDGFKLKSGTTSKWTEVTGGINSDYSKVGINNTSPKASLDVKGGSYDGTPNTYGTQIAEGVIELTRSSYPYIDFNEGSDGSDYDARMIYFSSGDKLKLSGADFIVDYQLGVGVSSDVDNSAKLEIQSTSQGFLPPRMTTTQRDAVSNPAEGLVVYNTDTKCINFFNGATWYSMCGEYPLPVGPCGGVSAVEYNGQTYNTVEIGDQCWFRENLNTTKYRSGTSISNVTSNSSWASLSTGAYCNYNNSSTNGNIYGKLYNWYAVNTGLLCPEGWHVPSSNEFQDLKDHLYPYEGNKLKESGNVHWLDYNEDATNSTGFTALPGGSRNSNGYFYFINILSYWWTSTQDDGYSHFTFILNNGEDLIINVDNSGHTPPYGNYKTGMSIRCIKD